MTSQSRFTDKLLRLLHDRSIELSYDGPFLVVGRTLMVARRVCSDEERDYYLDVRESLPADAAITPIEWEPLPRQNGRQMCLLLQWEGPAATDPE